MSALAYEVLANLVAVVAILAVLAGIGLAALILGAVIAGRDRQIPR